MKDANEQPSPVTGVDHTNGYAFPHFTEKPVGSTFWAGGELLYKFSQTEAVRFEDAYIFDSSDGKIKQQHDAKSSRP